MQRPGRLQRYHFRLRTNRHRKNLHHGRLQIQHARRLKRYRTQSCRRYLPLHPILRRLRRNYSHLLRLLSWYELHTSKFTMKSSAISSGIKRKTFKSDKMPEKVFTSKVFLNGQSSGHKKSFNS